MRIILLIIVISASFNTHAQSGATELYLKTVRDNATLGKYPTEDELRNRASKLLDDLEKAPDSWKLVFQIIALHYEADIVLNRNQESARKELDRYNILLTKIKFARPNTNLFFDSIVGYLKGKGDPEVSEMWWRIFLSSGRLTLDPVERAKVWSKIIDAEIDQGAFTKAIQETDQWLAYEKNSESARYFIYLEKSRLGLLSNDLALLENANRQLATLKALSPAQQSQVKLKEFQALYKNNKFSECSKGLFSEISKSPIKRQIFYRPALIRCLLGENKISEAETQLHQLSKDVLAKKGAASKAEEMRAIMSVSIAKKQKAEAFNACIASVEPAVKEQSFNFLLKFATCVSLKPANEKMPNQLLSSYNTRKPELIKFAARSDWMQTLLSLIQSGLETNSKTLAGAKLKALQKFGADSLLGKAIQ